MVSKRSTSPPPVRRSTGAGAATVRRSCCCTASPTGRGRPSGGARHRPNRRRVPPCGHGLQPRVLGLVIPRRPGAGARAADRPGARRHRRPHARRVVRGARRLPGGGPCRLRREVQRPRDRPCHLRAVPRRRHARLPARRGRPRDAADHLPGPGPVEPQRRDRKSTRLNSSHITISYAVFCLKKKNNSNKKKNTKKKTTKKTKKK